MQVIFESRHAGGAEHREAAIERLRFTTRRLAWLISSARLQLSDINGPRGGTDKQCQIELKTSTGTVLISSLATDWRSALDRALQRAIRVLVRSLQRQRRHDRSGQVTATSL